MRPFKSLCLEAMVVLHVAPEGRQIGWPPGQAVGPRLPNQWPGKCVFNRVVSEWWLSGFSILLENGTEFVLKQLRQWRKTLHVAVHSANYFPPQKRSIHFVTWQSTKRVYFRTASWIMNSYMVSLWTPRAHGMSVHFSWHKNVASSLKHNTWEERFALPNACHHAMQNV
jgi:hypothetical protein